MARNYSNFKLNDVTNLANIALGFALCYICHSTLRLYISAYFDVIGIGEVHYTSTNSVVRALLIMK